MSPRSKPALGPGLLAKKGEPSTSSVPQPGRGAPAGGVSGAARPKALTLKLDAERYLKLRLYAAHHDMTHQDILVAALDAFLPK
jgi:hypothetical protein